MLCFGWYCVERAQAGRPQPEGNQRLRRAGKSAKSGAKCVCYFLAVSRVAESATQSQLFPSRHHHPPPPPPPSPLLFPHFESSLLSSSSLPLNWTATGRLCLSAEPCHSLSPEPQVVRGAVMPEAALHSSAPADAPCLACHLLHQRAQVAHVQKVLFAARWE